MVIINGNVNGNVNIVLINPSPPSPPNIKGIRIKLGPNIQLSLI